MTDQVDLMLHPGNCCPVGFLMLFDVGLVRQ